MPIIQTISPEKAEGKVAEMYSVLKESIGFVPNALQMFSASTPILEMQFHKMGYFMKHPTISPSLLAMIRMLVSVEHDCPYCIDLNASILMQQGFTPEAVESTKKNRKRRPLKKKTKQCSYLF